MRIISGNNGVVVKMGYYQTTKGRLIGIGCALILVGFILYLNKGIQFALVLPVVGIVMVVAGVLYNPKKKMTETTSKPL